MAYGGAVCRVLSGAGGGPVTTRFLSLGEIGNSQALKPRELPSLSDELIARRRPSIEYQAVIDLCVTTS